MSTVMFLLFEADKKKTKINPYALVSTTVGLMLPQFIIILYGYFTASVEIDDYKLPLREW